MLGCIDQGPTKTWRPGHHGWCGARVNRYPTTIRFDGALGVPASIRPSRSRLRRLAARGQRQGAVTRTRPSTRLSPMRRAIRSFSKCRTSIRPGWVLWPGLSSPRPNSARSDDCTLSRSRFNERQSKVIARMFREGIDGFKGGLSAENHIKIRKTSRATATRRFCSDAGRNVSFDLTDYDPIDQGYEAAIHSAGRAWMVMPAMSRTGSF